jgi:Ino eighty subunit 2
MFLTASLYHLLTTVYQIKKHLWVHVSLVYDLLTADMSVNSTQEEQNMRRSEMARRRKNLSEKKVMEEKESTINKLLKKQTSKRRGANAKPETLAAAVAAEGAENESLGEETVEKANPLYTRWISDRHGVRLGVPEEWLGKHVGRAFVQPNAMSTGNLVE